MRGGRFARYAAEARARERTRCEGCGSPLRCHCGLLAVAVGCPHRDGSGPTRDPAARAAELRCSANPAWWCALQRELTREARDGWAPLPPLARPLAREAGAETRASSFYGGVALMPGRDNRAAGTRLLLVRLDSARDLAAEARAVYGVASVAARQLAAVVAACERVAREGVPWWLAWPEAVGATPSPAGWGAIKRAVRRAGTYTRAQAVERNYRS